ncbi:hypothetical protein FSP39_023024 [Pinctada imbricata]|uniref:Poly [ADP-ribose] polymerase n=1 Tax=Pinctada imbricata TaxID=66713 RepID=A0AA88Y5U7_PINIB|nr:hypothetical protein FSP39_023024 [Pinctada imbricata]
MSVRQKRFEDDLAKANELCTKYKWPVTDLAVNENTLTFLVAQNDGTKRNYSLHISDDYPDNTFMSIVESPDYSRHCHSPIQNLIQSIVGEVQRGNKEPDVQTLAVPPSAQRSVSMESEASSYVDCNSSMESDDDDDDDDMDEDYYNELEAIQPEIATNPVLAKDMESLRRCYNEDVLSYRLLDSIDEIDIEINFPLSKFLEKEIVEAWRLNQDEPLVVRLHLSLNSYLDTPTFPRVEVFQPSKRDCGVAAQLRKILENFLSEQWPHISNQQINTLHSNREKAEEKSKQESQPTNVAINVDDADIARIMEMGFSAEHAQNALILNHGDLLKAINDLMGKKDSSKQADQGQDANQYDCDFPELGKPNKLMPQFSHPPTAKRKKKKKDFTRQKSSVASVLFKESGTDDNDLTLKPSSTWYGRNSKRIPPNDLGFLVMVFQYIRQRLPTLNEYCVVCDEPHVFQNGAMLKPAVCSRELCVFAFQTLGVMADAAEDIATGAEVVDLLVAMTKAASKSNRKRVIFSPYPTIVDPKDPQELAINPKNRDYDAVEKVVDCIMSIHEMTKLGTGEIKKELDKAHILAYPLLQWIITSNRSHIVKLPEERRLSFMHTPHQFLLMSSPPAKEARFREAKQKHSSTFAFHGSGIENWHSIIREGLIVASGTNRQVNGAAYGKGIYLSPIASTSFGYSRMGYGSYNKKKATSPDDSKKRFLSSSNISCIALCEVITSGELKKSGSIWVCPNPDHVCTRFFFV